MKKFLSFFILISCYLALISPALADDEVRDMTFDLKAKGYTQNEWKDNLDSSNIIFAPRDKFQLQLIIKNWGNRNQTNVHVWSRLPDTITVDMPDFTINQLTPNQEYTQNLVVTVKDKNFVSQNLASNSIWLGMKTDVGTVGEDAVTFYTSGGLRGVATPTPKIEVDINTPRLPDTGPAATIIFGSILAFGLIVTGLRLRRLGRGY